MLDTFQPMVIIPTDCGEVFLNIVEILDNEAGALECRLSVGI